MSLRDFFKPGPIMIVGEGEPVTDRPVCGSCRWLGRAPNYAAIPVGGDWCQRFPDWTPVQPHRHWCGEHDDRGVEIGPRVKAMDVK